MIAVCCIAAALVIGLAIASVSNAKTKLAEQNRLAANTDECAEYWEEEERFFSTIEEYEAFLLQQEVESGRCSSIEDAEVVYYAPATLPEGVSLAGITYTSFATTFDYTVDRPDRNLSFDPSVDEALAEVLNNARVQIYSPNNSYSNFVSDFREYGDNLAYCIDASLIYTQSDQDIYCGSVYYDAPSNGDSLSILAGHQYVTWQITTDPSTNQTTEILNYSYLPNALPQTEINSMITVAPHTANGCDNN